EQVDHERRQQKEPGLQRANPQDSAPRVSRRSAARSSDEGRGRKPLPSGPAGPLFLLERVSRVLKLHRCALRSPFPERHLILRLEEPLRNLLWKSLVGDLEASLV